MVEVIAQVEVARANSIDYLLFATTMNNTVFPFSLSSVRDGFIEVKITIVADHVCICAT